MSMTDGSRRAASGWIARISALFVLAFLTALSPPAGAAQDEAYRRAGDLAAYLGVLPAAVVRGHPAGHPEGAMHGGAPRGRHDYHLVVALFDAASGARIEDAAVTATISGLGHVGGRRLQLEPMRIAGTITYGEFVSLPGSDRYTITVEIRRPNQAVPTRVDFTYQHPAR